MEVLRQEKNKSEEAAKYAQSTTFPKTSGRSSEFRSARNPDNKQVSFGAVDIKMTTDSDASSVISDKTKAASSSASAGQDSSTGAIKKKARNKEEAIDETWINSMSEVDAAICAHEEEWEEECQQVSKALRKQRKIGESREFWIFGKIEVPESFRQKDSTTFQLENVSGKGTIMKKTLRRAHHKADPNESLEEENFLEEFSNMFDQSQDQIGAHAVFRNFELQDLFREEAEKTGISGAVPLLYNLIMMCDTMFKTTREDSDSESEMSLKRMLVRMVSVTSSIKRRSTDKALTELGLLKGETNDFQEGQQPYSEELKNHQRITVNILEEKTKTQGGIVLDMPRLMRESRYNIVSRMLYIYREYFATLPLMDTPDAELSHKTLFRSQMRRARERYHIITGLDNNTDGMDLAWFDLENPNGDPMVKINILANGLKSILNLAMEDNVFKETAINILRMQAHVTGSYMKNSGMMVHDEVFDLGSNTYVEPVLNIWERHNLAKDPESRRGWNRSIQEPKPSLFKFN